MTRRPSTFASVSLALAIAAAAAGLPARAADGTRAATATVHVFINPRRDTGYPWHGPGDLFVLGGKMVTHLPEAPGAVLCLVTSDGHATCPGKVDTGAPDKSAKEPAPAAPHDASAPSRPHLPSLSRGNRPQSPCPSSYDCEFDDIALPKDEMFAIVVIDPAMAFINLVDAVILTRKPVSKKDPAVLAFDQRLREAVAELAPPGPFEAKRRTRPFQVRNLDECEDGCPFTQSKINIELD